MYNEKQTIELTDEKLQDIYINEEFRNQVAYAHWQCKAGGERLYKITCSYPITYKVTDEQIQIADTERLRSKAETIANLHNKLVFVGMGMTYNLTEVDDIGNFRIRTEFINKKGNRYFVEFGQDARCKGNLRCDFSIDRTKQDLLKDSWGRQHEFYNFAELEREQLYVEYSKKAILELINKHFDCNFSVMEIDNYNLRTDDFVCQSPK